MIDIPIQHAVLEWNEARDGGEVIVRDHRSRQDHRASIDAGILQSAGADGNGWATASTETQLSWMLASAWGAVLRDGVEPRAVHEALCVVPEYRFWLSRELGELGNPANLDEASPFDPSTLPRYAHGHAWGPWVLDAKTLGLCYSPRSSSTPEESIYDISLADIRTANDLVWAINNIRERKWGTTHVAGHLLDAMLSLYRPPFSQSGHGGLDDYRLALRATVDRDWSDD